MNEEQAAEVSIIEKLRSVPNEHRSCVAIQWAEDGTETGHRFIPVGYMMHEAADALESADKRIAELEAQLSECQKDAERYRFVRNKPEMLLHLSNREFDRSIDKAIEETRK